MFCTRTCVEWIASGWKHRPAGQPIQVIIEAGKGVGEVVDYLYALQEAGAPWLAPFISFAPGPKSLKPLQAADYVAHECARRTQEAIHPTGHDIRKSFKRLIQKNGVTITYWTRKQLLDGLPVFRDTAKGSSTRDGLTQRAQLYQWDNRRRARTARWDKSSESWIPLPPT